MATKKQWLASIKTWIERFGLADDHQVRHDFVNTSELVKRGITVKYAAGTSSMPEYKDHAVDVGLPWLHQTNPDKIDEVTCHEAIHMVTSPTHALVQTILNELPMNKQDIYSEWWHRENEEVTTQICNILMRVKEWKK